ncbi:MAG: glucuronate isomerase [Bacteroidota bacterium]
MSGNKFIADNFLLQSKYAVELYHGYASKMPIIDYHNHLPVRQIALDKTFDNITEVWISGDHYKWRAMRALGVDDKFITGQASSLEKFQKWAHTVPYTVRNPLYHWTHLELARYFNYQELLSDKNADIVFQLTQEKLAAPKYSCRNLLEMMNVKVLCTTEDPTDTLEYHQTLERSDFGIKVGTAFRPDKAILIGNEDYNTYLDALEEASGTQIGTYQDLCDALLDRLHYFKANGCSISDHGLSYVPFEEASPTAIEAIFQKRRAGKIISPIEQEQFMTALLLFLGERYHQMGWVQQFHLGALRNNNTRMGKVLGPDTGWDSIGDFKQAATLSRFLSTLDDHNKLSKTILYNLNPADNEVLATMAGNFNDGSVKGKVQFGSGWWFLDQKDGIEKQLNALSNMGMISTFIGMLTDSRSFLSFPRHEYFRRILCNLFGAEMQRGELPNDIEWIGKIIQDICYNNAKEYFNF